MPCSTLAPCEAPAQPPGRDWPLRTHLALWPLPTAVPCARLHARLILREWHVAELTDSAELITSELVTNASTACRSVEAVCPIGLWLTSDGRRVVILVSDASQDPPVPMNPDTATEGGRGLMLVEAVSAQWDWYSLPQGKVVWALCET